MLSYQTSQITDFVLYGTVFIEEKTDFFLLFFRTLKKDSCQNISLASLILGSLQMFAIFFYCILCLTFLNKNIHGNYIYTVNELCHQMSLCESLSLPYACLYAIAYRKTHYIEKYNWQEQYPLPELSRKLIKMLKFKF